MSEKEWEVWSEGFVIQGSDSQARFHGRFKASTFKDACIECFKKDPEGYFREKDLSHWGCKLFDNEIDARKEFG